MEIVEDNHIEVVWPSIRRRLRETESSVYVLLKVPGMKDPSAELLADMERALQAANAALDRDGEELVWAQGIIPSQKGPMVDLDWIGTDEQTQEWLDEFAEGLAARGWSGRLTAAPNVFLPRSFDEYYLSYRLTTTLGLRFENISDIWTVTGSHWGVSSETTARWASFAVDWGHFPGSTVYLGESTATIITSTPLPARELAAGAIRSAQARVWYLAEDPCRNRAVEFDAWGKASFQAGATSDGTPILDWRKQFVAARDVIEFDPTAVDWAFVDLAAGFGRGPNMYRDGRPAPWVSDPIYAINRQMWDRFVPDVFGAQLLTSKHLERAHDLTDWDVAEIAPERFMVQSRHLDRWWSNPNPDPDPELLTQARADFGSMLMTFDDIAADPHGWIAGRRGPDRG